MISQWKKSKLGAGALLGPVILLNDSIDRAQ